MSEVKKAKRNYYKLGGGIAALAVGLAIGFFGNATTNAFLIVIGIAVAFAGGYFIWQWWKSGTGVYYSSKGSKPALNANSFNIYPDRVAFEFMNQKDLKGHPKQFTNDGKFYHVHWMPPGGKVLEEFKLPDVEHGENPREIGEVLQADIIRRCLAYVPTSMIQTIALGLVVVIIIAEIIGLIAMP